jgi:hypothetical protein
MTPNISPVWCDECSINSSDRTRFQKCESDARIKNNVGIGIWNESPCDETVSFRGGDAQCRKGIRPYLTRYLLLPYCCDWHSVSGKLAGGVQESKIDVFGSSGNLFHSVIRVEVRASEYILLFDAGEGHLFYRYDLRTMQ